MFKIFILPILISLTKSWCLNQSVMTNSSNDSIYSMDFSLDDQYFIVARHSGKLQRWYKSNYTVKDVYVFSPTAGAYCARYSRDGNLIAVSGKTQNVDILNASALTKIISLPTGMTQVYSIDWRYDNQALIAAGSDSQIQIWRIADWNINDSIPTLTSPYYSIAYAPDGKFVVAGYHSLIAFNANGTEQFVWSEGIWSRVAAKPDSQYFIATNQYNYFIQSDWNGNLSNFTYGAGFGDCDYSSDLQYFAVGSFASQTFVYDATSLNLTKKFVRGNGPISLGSRFSHNSIYLIVGQYRLSLSTGKIYQYFHLPDFFNETTCIEFCGDFVTWTYACDNQIDIPYDGCYDDCTMMPDFLCNVTADHATICSYTGTLQLVNVTFNTTSPNESYPYVITFQIEPPLYAFKISTFKGLNRMFSFNSSILERKSFNFDKNTGIFTMGINASQPITLQDIVILYEPHTNPLPEFWAGHTQLFEFKNEDNPIVFTYYSSQQRTLSNILLYICYVLMIMGWICSILGIILKRLAGIEAMFVLQFSWLNIVCTNSTFILPFKSLLPLRWTCFYNHLLLREVNSNQNTQQSPYISQFGMSLKLFSNNFNISLIILILSLIFLIVTYVKLRLIQANVSISPQNALEIEQQSSSHRPSNLQMTKNIQATNEINLNTHYDTYSYHQFGLQLMLSCVMLNLIYFTFASTLFFKYGTITHILSLLIFIFTTIVMITVILKFHFDPCPFDYFRFSFRSTKLALHHWYFHIVINILVSLLVVISSSKFSWSPAIVCLALLIFTLVYRPYNKFSDNLRSGWNLFVMCSFIGFRFFIEQIPPASLNLIMPTYIFLFLIVCIGLGSVVVVGILSSVYYWYVYRFISQQTRKARFMPKYDRVLYELSISKVTQQMSQIKEKNVFKQLVDEEENIKKWSNFMKTQYEEHCKKMEGYSLLELNLLESNPQITKRHKQIIEEIRMKNQTKPPQNENNVSLDFPYEKRLQQSNQKTGINSSRNSATQKQQSQLHSQSQDTNNLATQVLIQQNKFINYKGAVEIIDVKRAQDITQNFITEYQQIY